MPVANHEPAVYALCHPVTGEVRYIGKAAVSIKLRYQEHLLKAKKHSRTHLQHWIRSLEVPPVQRVLGARDSVGVMNARRASR